MRMKSLLAAISAATLALSFAATGASAQFFFGPPAYSQPAPYYAPGPYYAPRYRHPDRRQMVYGNVCMTRYITCRMSRLTPLNAPCHCRTSNGDIFHGRVGAR